MSYQETKTAVHIANLHGIELLAIVCLYKLGGVGCIAEFHDDYRPVRCGIPGDLTFKNMIAHAVKGCEAYLIIRKCAMPSAAGATKAKKSEGVINDGTASTASVTSSDSTFVCDSCPSSDCADCAGPFAAAEAYVAALLECSSVNRG